MDSSLENPPEARDAVTNNDDLITSNDPTHPANLICTLCRNFYNLGWVTGTGGGTSIVQDSHIFIAPSGVQKELIQPSDIFVLQRATRSYLRKPSGLKPSACTPLFLAAFDRGAGCCIHTHSQWAVLVTLLVEEDALIAGTSLKETCFEIEEIEQIKGLPKGKGKLGMMGFYDRLQVPIIDNTAHEEDLTQSLEEAMDKFPDTYAVLVRRHGVYVWGDNVHKAKTQAESLDYIFRLAVEMHSHGLPWTKEQRNRRQSRLTRNIETQANNTGQVMDTMPRRDRPQEVLMDASCENIQASGKGKRGRPAYDEESSGEGNEIGVATKKRRGPACKNMSVEGSGLAPEQSTKRGPGRPRKSV
ncbi:MAG: hypothetical protein Q9191_001387 [Dirinaria sp. TL-2023a]